MRTGLCLCVQASLLLLSVAACGFCQQAPEREIATESLLMDVLVFPGGWMSTGVSTTPDHHGAREHLETGVYKAHTFLGAYQQIYRYRCLNAAKREYRRQLDVFYTKSEWYSVWREREDLGSRLPFADESLAACSDRRMSRKMTVIDCRMLARYDEYVVRFHTEVIPPELTFEDLGAILEALDAKFAAAMAVH